MKKYVQVGCGIRGSAYNGTLLSGQYDECAQLCGLYDLNPKRAEYVNERCKTGVPVYADFDQMLAEVKPDTVIVTSKDCTHDEYIIKALKAGCDVISEKPLTTTFEKALAIQKAEKESGKKVYVTFNLRFSPFYKEILKSGTIGEIFSVHVEWMLDTHHGADYFRRWHRERANSGSLLVHKSTHHFDLINWYLEQEPLYVHAFGKRRFYGTNQPQPAERCLECEERCPYYFNIDRTPHREVYLNCEGVDGYKRDKCIFSDEIDIEDTISVSVEYSGGALLTYSLNAHCPYEGHVFTFNGSKGRLEVRSSYHSSTTSYTQSNTQTSILLYDREHNCTEIPLAETNESGHGGADGLLFEGLLRGKEEDPLCQFADTWAGMMSIGIGMGANLSMKENRRVALSEFFKELEKYE